MENRFGLKDLLVTTLLGVIIILIFIKMMQDDRHWSELKEIQVRLDEQTRDFTQIRRLLTSGLTVNPNPTVSPSPVDHADLDDATFGDPFRRIRQVQQLPDYAQGDWMVEVFPTSVPKLNELTSQDVYSRVVYSRVMESLADYDIEQRRMVPLLAKRWRMADDGLSMTIWLRENATFSNGDPFNADDVVYTHQLMSDSNIVNGRVIEYYRRLKTIEKLDDYTIRIHFTEVFYENFLRSLDFKVHSKKFMSQFTARQIREHPALLVGTGPYRLPDPERYKPGDQIEVVRNERYWGVAGPWDRIIWRILEKDSSRFLAYQNGNIDGFATLPEQHVQMLQDQTLVDRSQHYIYAHILRGYSYIAWNQQRKGEPTVFADKRVRQAMTMLIDRQRLIDEVYLGYAVMATGPFYHEGVQHNEAVKPWPHDPSAAMALLKEAGFTRSADGVLLKPDGEPFEIDFVYSAGSEFSQKIAFMIKDHLANGGIHLKLNPLKWSLMLKRLDEKDFDAITLMWGAGGLESDIEQMFHSRTIKDGDNRNAYINPELDRFIERAHVTLDKAQRMTMWKQCHAILHEDQPYTFLVRPKTLLWLDRRIANVKLLPVFGINFVSSMSVPIEWYVPKDEQKHSGQIK